MIIYPDLEFVPDLTGPTGTLAWGIVSDDDNGPEFYAINRDADWHAAADHAFIRDNVLPNLPIDPKTLAWDRDHPDFARVLPLAYIANQLAYWIEAGTDTRARAVTYYGAGDLQRIHQLWGSNWAIMPNCVPRTELDLKELATALDIELPGVDNGTDPHHALSDARHHRTLHRSLIGKTFTIR